MFDKQEKQTGKDIKRFHDEIVEINDKLIENESNTPTQHKNLTNYDLLCT